MDKEKLGMKISHLRKKAGYTQKDLADRIGISDKAVSKWERGLGMPDISYLGKLAILLDTDIDSLLADTGLHHEKEWRGLLVLPNNLEGVGAGTIIYDKPLVYFLLGYFLLVGIKQIYIVCNKNDQNYMNSEFGYGESLGIKLNYCGQEKSEVMRGLSDTDGYGNLMVVFGRSFLYGVDQTRFFQRAMAHKDKITVLSLPKKIENRSLSFNESRKVVTSDSKDKVRTQYDYYEIPVLFCPIDRIMDLSVRTENQLFTISLSECRGKQLYTEVLDRGFVEMPMNNMDQVFDVSNFTRLVQNACGMEIYCLEEIAWRRGMISLEKLKEFGYKKRETNYGKYILSLTDRYKNIAG